MSKVLVYTAYPDPLDKASQIGNVYNADGGAVWDCRCGATGLLAGGLSDHECFATREDEEAHRLQSEIAGLGDETNHPNIRAIDTNDIPSEFLVWLDKIGEKRTSADQQPCLDCGKIIYVDLSRGKTLCSECFYQRLI